MAADIVSFISMWLSSCTRAGGLAASSWSLEMLRAVPAGPLALIGTLEKVMVLTKLARLSAVVVSKMPNSGATTFAPAST